MHRPTIAMLTHLPAWTWAGRVLGALNMDGYIESRPFVPPIVDLTPDALAGCDALIYRPTDGIQLEPRHIELANRPFWVATLSSGTDHLRGVQGIPSVGIIRSEGGNADGVAELTMMMAMALCRKQPISTSWINSGIMEPARLGRITRLEGKTWLVLGAGHQVTSLIAQTAMLGIREFRIWNPSMDETRFRKCLSGLPKSMYEFASSGLEAKIVARPGKETSVIAARSASPEPWGKHVDIVSIHVPAVPRDPTRDREGTIGLVGRSFLSGLNTGAFVINMSRGDIVDEDAIVQVLRSGTIAGYGADVIRTEAEASRSPGLSPLWTFAMENSQFDPENRHNLMITSHTAGSADIDFDNVSRQVVEILLRELSVPAERWSAAAVKKVSQ